MKKAFSLAALLVAFYLNIHAQTLTAMRDSIPGGYDFWFYEPCNGSKHFDSQSPKKPLVVYLHGKSLSGHDLNKVRRYGTIHAIEKGLDIDAFVAAPQTTPPSWNPEKVWQMVQWCCAHYPIDRDRIYVLGMSMGGSGSFNTAAAYPDKFAAAMPICGNCHAKSYCSLCTIPIYALHGTEDHDMPITLTEKVVNGMIACGDTSRLIFLPLQGRNHSVLARLFYLKETYDWLFSHSLKDPGRPVCKDIRITNSMLDDAYSHLIGKAPHITVIDNGYKGKEVVSANTKVSADMSSTKAPSNKKTSGRIHKVKKGDTLASIAKRNHTTVKTLCRMNGLKETSVLQIRQKIKLP